MDELETLCQNFGVDIVILTLPKDRAIEAASRVVGTGVKGIWNFTGKELELEDSNIVIENEHIGDSLMTLCYEISRKDKEK
jgi:redox-sensing transcriptional repressor